MSEDNQTATGNTQARSAVSISTGLTCIGILASHHQRAIDPAQLARSLAFEPGRVLSDTDILRTAREVGLKAKFAMSSWDRLGSTPLPAIATLSDGERIVILRVLSDDRVVDADPREPRATVVTRETFSALWTGQLCLVKTRLRLDNPNRPFDIGWFIPVIWKYRRILGEILVAAFVIQLFGLVTPLFTQVIIDKVLMHKSLSTLHVLAAGMLILIVFEALLSVLRAQLMAHTSNRIDVGLGQSCFGTCCIFRCATLRSVASAIPWLGCVSWRGFVSS